VKTYVLGAGVSKTAGYPLGTELFDAIDAFVRESGPCHNRFDYGKDWSDLHNWLATNANPAITQAYRTRNIEHLFTALDFVETLRSEALIGGWDRARTATDPSAKEASFEIFETFDREVDLYGQYRRVLMWALEHYFSWRHYEDCKNLDSPGWDILNRFAARVTPGDVVITFNYDATLERALMAQGKWSPSDGFGFDLEFQESRYDKTPVVLSKSQIVVLHLHGATGWYRRPAFAPDFPLPPQGHGALPREAFGPAPLGTNISLDPEFLRGLGIFNVDACLPDAPPMGDERHVMLHPSFLKDYETDESGSHVFTKLWRKAAQALQDAERAYVVGYSLPKADSAALTLFLTSCRDGLARVVNPDGGTKLRLGRLLRSGDSFAGTATLEEWVDAGCPDQMPWRPRADPHRGPRVA
jgi:hypothetical protein